MTSHYAGVNKQEHLAELWSDLLTDYKLYTSAMVDHPVFEENTDKLLIFMNEIIETVDGEKLDHLEDILKFDGLEN